MLKSTFYLSCFLSFFSINIFSQCVNGLSVNGDPCGGTIRTAVPFLNINPDARSGAMGDAGIATSPDANALHFNASKLAFVDKKFGVAVNYVPWLRNLGVNDIFLVYTAGFLKVGEKQDQVVAFSHRYFNLGRIEWTSVTGGSLGTGKPHEQELAFAYARKLSTHFAMGVTAKYIYSNLATGQTVSAGIEPIRSGESVALDLSMTYHKPLKINGLGSDLTVGLAVKNVGTKLSYLRQANFLPANLGLGVAWKTQFQPEHSFTFTIDANKLLVPTPDSTGAWRNKSVLEGMWSSFSDAPGGFKEELQEINLSYGCEYWFRQFLSARLGYFYEPFEKGGRQYFTCGMGLRYKWASINLSYLFPTKHQRGPLDNTLRFSILINAADFKI